VITASHLRAGNWAEKHACKILKKRGLRLLERNFRSRFGEIDLVMRDGTYVVFVEVRLRKNESHGSAAESIDRHKQRRLRKTAERYLIETTGGIDTDCRFDVFTITGDSKQAETQWISNAF
jgi:putative endonuclease